MLELTPDFIKEYEIYLSTEAGLHNGSNCMWLKSIVSKAHYNGLTPRNTFAQHKVSPNIKDRIYLTEQEIKTVMTHEFEKQIGVCSQFVRVRKFYRPVIRGYPGTDYRGHCGCER